MPKPPAPKVGEVVRYDGRDHAITAVTGAAVEFKDATASRGTDRQHLELIEPGVWGIVGRRDARPAGARVGVQLSPATPTEG